MSVYAGRKGMVYLSTTAAGAASAVLSLTQWTLDQTTDKIPVTAFGDANKTYVQGLKDVTGAFSGFFNDAETKPFTAADSADGCKLYLYPSTDAPTIYWYGPAWLDASIETTVDGAITLSGNFAANGAWSKKP